MTKVLVILAYWGAHHDGVTQAQAKKLVITEANAWYRAASFGRQGLTGTATPWVKVPTQACGDFYGGIFSAAEAAARRIHYDSRKYQRVVVYEPCQAGAIGLGAEPGNKLLLFSGGMNMPTAVHEMGHNYGLDHANLYACRQHGKNVTFTAGSSCAESEYSDYSSAMALDWNSSVAGDFTAPEKDKLGWLSGHLRVIKHNATISLAPYETSAGTKAARVPGSSGRTYYLEYRTARGNDTKLPSNYRGVLIHLSKPATSGYLNPSQSLLMDMLPNTPVANLPVFGGGGASAADHMALPPGSSWTSPEGIRFTVVKQSNGGAVVRITRGQHVRAPSAVTGLHAVASDENVTVTFHSAADNGNLVHYYRVTAAPSGRSTTIRNYAGTSTHKVTIAGLKNGTRYRLSVTADNEAGIGHAAVSPAVTPAPALPSVAITSPAVGAHVHGIVTIKATAHPNAVTKKSIVEVDYLVDGHLIASVPGRTSTSTTWDTGLIGNAKTGAHTITVIAKDTRGRSARKTISVTVTQTTAPGLAIVAPTANATVSGIVRVSGTLARRGPEPIDTLDLYVDGDFVNEIAPPHATWSFAWDSTTYSRGQHTLRVEAMDEAGRVTRVTRVVTVAHPAPGIAITAPASGVTVLGSVPIQLSVTNLAGVSTMLVTVAITDSAHNHVFDDSQNVDGGAKGSSTPVTTTQPWDTTSLAPGTYLITAVASDDYGFSSTVTRTLTVAHPAPAVTITAPAAGATVSGAVPIGLSVTNPYVTGHVSVVVDVTDSASTDVFDDFQDIFDLAHGATGTVTTADWDTRYLVPGTYLITATVSDDYGFSSTVTRTLTVAHPAPAVTITAPAAGATVSGAVPIGLSVTNPYVTGHVSVVVNVTDSTGSDVFDDFQDVVDLAHGATKTVTTAAWDTSAATPGQCTITVTVTDDYGVAGTTTRTVHV